MDSQVIPLANWADFLDSLNRALKAMHKSLELGLNIKPELKLTTELLEALITNMKTKQANLDAISPIISACLTELKKQEQ